MNVQQFIKENLDDERFTKDYNRYVYLKRVLERHRKLKEETHDRCELFHEFLILKDKLFSRAMDKFLKRRESPED